MTLKKRSFSIAGHRTSIALEPEFWSALDAAARDERLHLAALVARIDAKRGARPLAILAGWGMTSDAHHLVMPSTDQTHVISAMRQAIETAGITPGEPGYINAHAPGTPAGDAMEAQAIRQVAEETGVSAPVSSTKGATGHLLAAAASLELAMGVACLGRQAIPPTLNLETIDPACDGIDHVHGQCRSTPIRWVLSNAFGFGGSNCSVVIRSANKF